MTKSLEPEIYVKDTASYVCLKCMQKTVTNNHARFATVITNAKTHFIV